MKLSHDSPALELIEITMDGHYRYTKLVSKFLGRARTLYYYSVSNHGSPRVTFFWAHSPLPFEDSNRLSPLALYFVELDLRTVSTTKQ
jgi:hypothetical protein